MDLEAAIQLGVLACLFALSGFFSSAETAMTTVNRLRIKILADEGNKKAIMLSRILGNSEKMLSTVLIGSNLANITASALATVFTQRVFGNYAVSISTGIMILLTLVIGDIIPKTYATIHSEQISLSYAYIIYAVMWILTPVIFIVQNISFSVLKILRVKIDIKLTSYTENELRSIVEVSHEEGIIESEEKKMINNVFDFGDATAREVMIPKIEMTMADVKSSFEELIDIFSRDRYTRIPIYQDSPDNIIGIINMKDLLLYNHNESFDIQKYLREPFFTYESKKVTQLMYELKKTSINLIIVLDEYGDTAGLISIEDLLEEIVGEIRDEYDSDEEEQVEKINDKEFILEGQMNLNDVNEILGTELESEDYDTLGGIIIEYLDRLPEIGDVVELDGLVLKVVTLVGKRIHKVHVYLK